jgi:hypothetical protein
LLLPISTEGFRVTTQPKQPNSLHEMLDYFAPLQGGDWGKAYEVE